MESMFNSLGSTLLKVIPVIAVVVIVPMVLTSLNKSAKARGKVQGGMVWLEYGLYFKIFSFVGTMVPCGLCILWFYVAEESKAPVLYMIIGFALLTLPLLIEALFVKISFDDSGAYCYSPWRPSRQVKFSDMEEPYFSDSLQWWVIPTKNQGKIRLQPFISGAEEFLEKLKGTHT